MGSQSRRFLASGTVDSELVYLYLFLFLCLGFLSWPADYGRTSQSSDYIYRGALNLEHGQSEILAMAHIGAFVLEQGTSEVIVTANSASNEYGVIREYPSPTDFLAEKEHELDNLGFLNLLYNRSDSTAMTKRFLRKLNNGVFRALSGSNAIVKYLKVSGNCFQGPFPGRTSLTSSRSVGGLVLSAFFHSDFALDGPMSCLEYGDLQKWVFSQLDLDSARSAEDCKDCDPRRRPWFRTSTSVMWNSNLSMSKLSVSTWSLMLQGAKNISSQLLSTLSAGDHFNMIVSMEVY